MLKKCVTMEVLKSKINSCYCVTGLKFLSRNLFACLQEVISSFRLFLLYGGLNHMMFRCLFFRVRCVWFGVALNDRLKNVETNVGKCFLSLIDKHFPKSNPLHKIFNRNTIKLSYSCMGNIKTIISNHNKAEINKSTHTDDQTKNCNCRKSSTCPMDGNCNMESIIYQAEVTTSTTKETYIGLCDTAFKLRYRNHVCSFRNERYKHATELSKYIWNLKR